MPGAHTNAQSNRTRTTFPTNAAVADVFQVMKGEAKRGSVCFQSSTRTVGALISPSCSSVGHIGKDSCTCHFFSAINLTAEKPSASTHHATLLTHTHTHAKNKHPHPLVVGDRLSRMISDWQEASRSEAKQTERHMFAHSRIQCDRSAPLGWGDIMGPDSRVAL